MLPRLLEFERAMRSAGIPVSVSESIDALKALEHIPLESKDSVRSALATTMVKSQSHRPTFDLLFDLYLGAGRGSVTSITDEVEDPEAAGQDLMDELVDTLATGDDAALAALARRAVSALGRVRSSPTGDWFSQYQVLQGMELNIALGRALRRTGVEGDAPLEDRLRREEFEARLERFREMVLMETRRRVAETRGAEAVARYAVRPRPEDLDFLSATSNEIKELRRAIRPLARKLASRVAMKRRRSNRGGLDMRRTVRRSLSTGGVPFDTAFRHRAPHRPELFVLCDISGSVSRFARFALMLVHALSAQFTKVRSFAFIDTLDEVTRLFEHEDFVTAVDRMNSEANVTWLDGHSDYGTSIEKFLKNHGKDLGPRSTVLILGDARNNYRATKDHALQEIARRARHVYWLNPEPVADWDTGDSAASEYAVHVDKMVEIRNLRGLEDFIAYEL
ncbi:MAG: VWA domain-containing protein [Actinobacteria bacterium]|nr:VWA domain-containing protein [Actinomycetota bacterium]